MNKKLSLPLPKSVNPVGLTFEHTAKSLEASEAQIIRTDPGSKPLPQVVMASSSKLPHLRTGEGARDSAEDSTSPQLLQ